MPLLPDLGQTLIFFFQPFKKFRNGCKHCLMKKPSNLNRIILQVSIHDFAKNLYKQWTELFSVYNHQLVTSHRHVTPFNAIYFDTVHNRRIAPEAISPFSLLAVHFCTYFWALSLEYSWRHAFVAKQYSPNVFLPHVRKKRTMLQGWEEKHSQKQLFYPTCTRQHPSIHLARNSSSTARHHKPLHTTPLTRIDMFSIFLYSHFT